MNSSKNNSGADLVSFLFGLQIAIKMFHWQTDSYAAHVESGALFGKIVDLTDEFIEQYMGIYGRPRMPAKASAPIANMTPTAMQKTLRDGIAYLKTRVPADNHLQNVRDELSGEMAKALYLLTMK